MTAADRPSVPRVGDTITTAEQLDALPSLTIVIDANDEVQQRHGHLATERGDYSAWLGVMPPTCKPSPEVALPATVLYVPGEQPCRHCGSCDGPPSCPDCDHADRPSVTDNARAEAERRWPHGKCLDPLLYGLMKDKQREFIEGAEWAAGRAETTTAHECDSGDFDRTICDCGAMHSYCTSCGTRQDDCPHETTTATIEDAARAIHDRHCTSDDHGPHCMFWGEDYESAEALHARGLLATARTRPTRDDLARAIASGYEPDHPTPNRHDYRAADAVLALLRGGA